MTASSLLPIITGTGKTRSEPRHTERIRRVAYYGPLEITYDCEETAADGEVNRDVIHIAFTPNVWAGPGTVKDPNASLAAALSAIQDAFNITPDELIENAPRREDSQD